MSLLFLNSAAFAAGPYFVGAGNLVASVHPESDIPLPSDYQEGDLLLFMGFTPVGMPLPPAGWTHACTYNYFKFATANETDPVFQTTKGAIGGIIAAYRGVHKNIPLPCVTEYGGQAGGIYGLPGTYYPPDGGQTPKFTSGDAPAFSVLYPSSLRVVTYQSESSDSYPIQVHDSSGTLTEDAFDMATYTTDCTDYFNLGFYSSMFTTVGSTGHLYFGTTGNGGGHRADQTCSYSSPVAWFSQILLIPEVVTTAFPAGGAYTETQYVELSMEFPGTIYYTTDGTTPNTESRVYSSPIEIAYTTALQFFGVTTEGLTEDTIRIESYTLPYSQPDTTAPVVTTFTIPATSSSLIVPITSFKATDAVGVTSYLVTESSMKPVPDAEGWSGTKPASYTFDSAGPKMLYAWAQDAAGNVSDSLSANIMITLPFEVTSPAAGETVLTGAPYAVTWTAATGAAFYKVKLSTDGGLTWSTLGTSLTDTNVSWTVPNTVTKNITNAIIKVIAFNETNQTLGAAKSGTFSIDVLTITAPTVGDIVPQNLPYNISWIANGTAAAPDQVVVKYSLNNGTTWKTAQGTLDVASFNWNVPAVTNPKNKVRVKVILKSVGNTVAKATSNKFTVQ